MIIHLLSCLVKHGSQSTASSIPVCGQIECCFAPCPSQRLLLQSERPKPPEAFAATPLSPPQRPEHTVQISEMHSHALFQPCFFVHGLTQRCFCFRARTSARWCHKSLYIMSASRALALFAQIALRPLWLVHIRWKPQLKPDAAAALI